MVFEVLAFFSVIFSFSISILFCSSGLAMQKYAMKEPYKKMIKTKNSQNPNLLLGFLLFIIITPL